MTIGGAAPVKDATELMPKPHTDTVVVCGEDARLAPELGREIVDDVQDCQRPRW